MPVHQSEESSERNITRYRDDPPDRGTRDDPPADDRYRDERSARRDGSDRSGEPDWPRRWLLTSQERGNPATRLDEPDRTGVAWTTGNLVRPLPHGASYFAELCRDVRRLRAGDLLMFTDWRGDPDERLDGPGTEVSRVFSAAAERGVIVKGLVWRSHLDRLQFSEQENRHLGDEIEAAGGECLLDMRVRTNGSHHQKFVVLRHRDRPDLDVAYVGGIDLCHSRRDTAEHLGDPQPVTMSPRYGPRPPWHDIQLAIRGPAVARVETVFRERWEDPSPLSRNPVHRLRALVSREDTSPDALPTRWPDPPPAGRDAVQLLRTYPYRRRGYPFAPLGERSVARGLRKALAQARRLIYVEDQYLWSAGIARYFADALAANPELHLVAVLPRHPDQAGAISGTPQLLGRMRALEALRAAGGDRVALYSLENQAGTPVYVHAKLCAIDDTWVSVGSDNLNMRSWSHDSELACAVVNQSAAGPDSLALRLRLALNREHLVRAGGDDADLRDPYQMVAAYAKSAAALDAWHARGRRGPRPPGRLRGYSPPALSRWTRLWAAPLYRLLFDPDGRPPALRRRGEF